jgi:hypothetical protein
MAARHAGITIYSTVVPMAGWRGSALLAIAAAIVMALPEAQTLTLSGLAAGAVLGVGLIVSRARAADRGREDDGRLHLSS